MIAPFYSDVDTGDADDDENEHGHGTIAMLVGLDSISFADGRLPGLPIFSLDESQ